MPVSHPISTLKGSWARLHSTERLRRSSQVISVIDQKVCIFGGEVQPRQPVDSQVDLLSIENDTPGHLTKSVSGAPSPRVGSASAVLDGQMYIFSGRGGTDMVPIEEDGAVWSFNPETCLWSKITPAEPSKPHPPARSYHCSTSDGEKTLFVHAGCPESGRLSDLWSFDVSARAWTQAADAPGPQRGGTSLAYNKNKLYRMNGFDGEKEQGGSIDIFDIAANSWSTKAFKADGYNGPEARSVAALVSLHLAGKDKLLTLFGERDPSSLGHASAGKMMNDVWIYDIGEDWWTQLHPEGNEGVPASRGWFDADVIKNANALGNDSIVIHGGLGEDNKRLGDVWTLKF